MSHPAVPLTPKDRARFNDLKPFATAISLPYRGPALLAPHANWAANIAEQWPNRQGLSK